MVTTSENTMIHWGWPIDSSSNSDSRTQKYTMTHMCDTDSLTHSEHKTWKSSNSHGFTLFTSTHTHLVSRGLKTLQAHLDSDWLGTARSIWRSVIAIVTEHLFAKAAVGSFLDQLRSAAVFSANNFWRYYYFRDILLNLALNVLA